MIPLQMLRRLSRLKEDYGKLWKELETPLTAEMSYDPQLGQYGKTF